MLRSRILVPALVVAVGGALLAAYALRLSMTDVPPAAPHPASPALPASIPAGASACDLNAAPCPVLVAEGVGQLEIRPRPIPVTQALQVVWREPVVPEGKAQPEAVELAFEGVEMEMGFNRARLTRQPDGSYAGNAMLPVCTSGSMRWRARIERGVQRGAASIEFTAPQQP